MKEGQIKKLLKIDSKECSHCGSALIKTHSRRNLQDLDKSYYIDTEIGRCASSMCPCQGIRIYPAEYKRLIYPKSDYSLRVYAEIGYQRLNESKSVSQISKSLSSSYPDLGLRERSIENIFKRVQVCLRQRQEDKEQLKQNIARSGISQLCLTIDGIAPERGNAILYVVREVQSQLIIYVRYLEHSDASHLVSDLFEPLKALLDELSCPLGGWLCDKQNGFIPALSSVFVGVPIHLCQAHFLKAMGKPVQAADSEMAKAIKKKLRPLKQIEKDLERIAIPVAIDEAIPVAIDEVIPVAIDDKQELDLALRAKEMEVAQLKAAKELCKDAQQSLATLCLLPRAWISRSISVTYELRGVRMYEQFTQAIETIKKMEQKRVHPLLSRLKEMFLQSIQAHQSTYEDLKKAHCFLEELTDILYGKKQEIPGQKQWVRLSSKHRKEQTASQVEQNIDQLIADFKQDNKKRSTLCREFILNFETTYKNWKPNIFTCYDHDFIPNDNNDLESNHNKVKRVIRKTTGHKSTAQALKMYGEELIYCQVFFDEPPEEFLTALADVNFNKVKLRQKELKLKQQKRGLKIRVINQTEKVLEKVLNDWR